jgi:ABC-type branched-subunit amino acid transport system substrate-binding protein
MPDQRLSKNRSVRMALLTLLASAHLAWGAVATEPTNEIVLGMSTVLSGPSESLGQSMRAGVECAIREVNARGGIHGRTLRLVALDDGYEPARTGPNMRQLIERERVLAIIGNVGTPTAAAAIPIANETGTPFIGAMTGAGILRKTPPDRWVVNFRASYTQETAAMVDALVQVARLKPEEIAVFSQRDAYGDAGFNGAIQALRRNGLPEGRTIAHGRYERNTVAVENAVADILGAAVPCRAIIMVGTYAPTAAFVKFAKESGIEAKFLSVSFVGSEKLAAALGSLGDGVVITQVVPHPESELPLAREYRVAAEKLDAPDGFIAFEGYTVMRMLEQALRSGHWAADRASIIEALEGLDGQDLGLGNPVTLGPADHQASDSVWPTVIRRGRINPFDWSEWTRLPGDDSARRAGAGDK